VAEQRYPTPERPNVPGGPDDHNKDIPEPEPDAAEHDAADRDDDHTVSDPGGDSDPNPDRDY